jgi:xanthine dehydrogenase accessory factor
MGHGDAEALGDALALGVGYVGLVASARRASSVLRTLRERGVDEEALAAVRSPAGLDLGPATQLEIAVAVLAELVAWRRRGTTPVMRHALAVDPVCGMEVAVTDATEAAEHEGGVFYFCCSGCRNRFVAEPDRYSHIRQ